MLLVDRWMDRLLASAIAKLEKTLDKCDFIKRLPRVIQSSVASNPPSVFIVATLSPLSIDNFISDRSRSIRIHFARNLARASRSPEKFESRERVLARVRSPPVQMAGQDCKYNLQLAKFPSPIERGTDGAIPVPCFSFGTTV